MANKVVQLKNKAGTDSLFPIAGGVTQDTITTAMLQDGAVTSAKVSNDIATKTYVDGAYTPFTGTDGTSAGTAGLVPAPATTDAGKFLKADGTWDSAGGGTLYTTIGSNEDGAMTQKATTEMVYLGAGATSPLTAQTSIVMGYGARAKSTTAVCIGAYTGVAGTSSSISNESSVMIGRHTSLLSKKITDAILIGRDSTVNGNTGEYTVSIGSLSAAGNSCIAIGLSANAGATGSSGSNHYYDVAIGSNAKASSSTTSSGDEHKSTVSVGAKAGYYANTAQVGTVCIGGKAGNSHYGDYDVFLGSSTDASANSLNYSVALGAYSKFSRASEVSVGDGSNNANYGTRYIANVKDPQNAQDAATKNYVDTQVGNIQTLLEAI